MELSCMMVRLLQLCEGASFNEVFNILVSFTQLDSYSQLQQVYVRNLMWM